VIVRGRLLLATRSEGKRRELEPLLRVRGWEVVDLARAGLDAEPGEDEALETADSFEENALAKARHFHARSGLPTVADDSGLSCEALGGLPGVRSKRWSGRPDLDGDALDAANNALLLQALADAARGGATSRAAKYVCAAAYVDGRVERVARGETAGRILERAEGQGGFGYDPLFWSDDLRTAFGLVSREEKSRVSHRARAVAALLQQLDAGS